MICFTGSEVSCMGRVRVCVGAIHVCGCGYMRVGVDVQLRTCIYVFSVYTSVCNKSLNSCVIQGLVLRQCSSAQYRALYETYLNTATGKGQHHRSRIVFVCEVDGGVCMALPVHMCNAMCV